MLLHVSTSSTNVCLHYIKLTVFKTRQIQKLRRREDEQELAGINLRWTFLGETWQILINSDGVTMDSNASDPTLQHHIIKLDFSCLFTLNGPIYSPCTPLFLHLSKYLLIFTWPDICVICSLFAHVTLMSVILFFSLLRFCLSGLSFCLHWKASNQCK